MFPNNVSNVSTMFLVNFTVFDNSSWKNSGTVECHVQTLGYKNHKSCKVLPKFSSTLHFLQESYKSVQESQYLQICYGVDHFLQDSDNIFFSKIIKLPATTNSLQCTNCPRIPAKESKLLNLSKKILHAILPMQMKQEMQKNCEIYAIIVTFGAEKGESCKIFARVRF